MDQLSSYTQRFSLDKNLKFQVMFDGKDVPAITSIRPLDEPDANVIALEREHTDDPSFKKWMDSVMMLAGQPDGLDDISSITKNVRVEQHDAEGNLVHTWTFRGCRPKRYQPHPASMGQPAGEDAVERLMLLYDDSESEA